MNGVFKFRFEKDEADTSLPTLEFMTREPASILHTPRFKASSKSLVFTSQSLPGFEGISGTVVYKLDASTPESVFYGGIVPPSKPIFLNENPARQIPSKKVHMSIYSDATIPSTRTDPLFENTKIFFQRLADEYSSGILDVPEITEWLGEPWTESTVILLLEVLGAHRSILMGQISPEEQENVLSRLAKIRGTVAVEKFNSTGWIQREVIASQRIESVYVFPDDLAQTA